MKELQLDELENINGGVNWEDVLVGSAEIIASIPEDASIIGAVAGGCQAGLGGITIMHGFEQ